MTDFTTTMGEKYAPPKYMDLIAETITADANAFAQFPFSIIDTYGVHYLREGSGNVDELRPQGCAAGTATIMDPDPVTRKLKFLTLGVEHCGFGHLYNGVTNTRDAQIKSILRKFGRILENLMINGSGSGTDATGLAAQVTQTTTVGTTLDFSVLDDLIGSVRVGRNSLALIVNRPIMNKIRALHRAGGFNYEQVTLENGASVAAYSGVPIFVSEFIRKNDNFGSGASIYCVSRDPEQGFSTLFGVNNPDLADSRVLDLSIGAIHKTGLLKASPAISYNLYSSFEFDLKSLQAAARAVDVRY